MARGFLAAGCICWGASPLAIVQAGGLVNPVEFSLISASDLPSGAPAYDFLVSRTEIRNDQFADFLNDAIENLDDPRGAYLHFETGSGDVFLQREEVGTLGLGESETYVFRPSQNQYITFSPLTNRYVIAEGGQRHPVTGVSWFGAVKFCNWMTLRVGQGESHRAYTEGDSIDLALWRPVTISRVDWAIRNLNNGERTALLSKRGFRLLMDGGFGANNPDDFNEWYKAAAWDPVRRIHRGFGFGRDAIRGADANYRCSGDPFEDAQDCIAGGSSPVGYFSGATYGSFVTAADENAHRLFDMSGNVWEWMQDQSFDPSDRRNRGGSFRSSPSTLAAAIGAERNAESVSDSTGFRIALVQPTVDGLLVLPAGDLTWSGPWGGPYQSTPTTSLLSIQNCIGLPLSYAIENQASWLLTSETNGDLLPGETDEVALVVRPVCDASTGAGEHAATIGVTVSSTEERIVRVNFSEPLSVVPNANGTTRMVYGQSVLPAELIFDVANASNSIIRWSAESRNVADPNSNEPALWIRLNGFVAAEESNPPGQPVALRIGFEEAAVRSLNVGVHSADIRVRNICTGGVFTRRVTLEVLAPFDLATSSPLTFAGVCGGPFSTAARVGLTNPHSFTLSWRVSDQSTEWLHSDPSSGTLQPGASTPLQITTTLDAAALPLGPHLGDFIMEASKTGYRRIVSVTFDVQRVAVSPDEIAEFGGALGGPFIPSTATFTLRGSGRKEMEWIAEFVDRSTPPNATAWLKVHSEHGTILEPDGAAEIDISPSTAASVLSPGEYVGDVIFRAVDAADCFSARTVRLRVGQQAFTVPTVIVPGVDALIGGPTHTFRIGKYEVTNSQFARFLNDAVANPEGKISGFLARDASGSVRLSGDNTLLFDPAISGAIPFDGAAYSVRSGKDSQPVAGVTWFGAAKFCNWLTLAQRMSQPDQRAYHEGPNRGDWSAIDATASTWIRTVRGFRLPMDAGLSGAGLFNEWHKAAIRLPDDAQGAAQFGAVYGFGRNSLLATDANFLASLDSSADLATPVGFYNGQSRLLIGGAVTRNTANGYRLYDMCGNVAEWVHDAGRNSLERGVRGGHFRSPAASPLLRAGSRDVLPSDSALDFVGFRIAQSLSPTRMNVSFSAERIVAFVGGPVATGDAVVNIVNPSDYSNDSLLITADQPWLEVESVDALLAPPGQTLSISLAMQPSATSAVVVAEPPSSFSRVPSEPYETPDDLHHYWMSRNETTNADYVTFLNDSKTDALTINPGLRSRYLYFDGASGFVYIHSAQRPVVGSGPPPVAAPIKIFDVQLGKIRYANGVYAAASGFENYPVVGVSWYGAVKYCNWRSLREGLPVQLLAYEESPSSNPAGWRAVGSDADMLNLTTAYRLPLDAGDSTPTPFNEWYFAAAMAQGNEPAIYAFGRNVLTPADANYFGNSDAPQDGPTSVGFFNGVNRLYVSPSACSNTSDEAPLTRAAENRENINDLCGNVAEWVHSVGDGSAVRFARGGSWRDASNSALLKNTARQTLFAGDVRDDVGFRIVRQPAAAALVTVRDDIADSRDERYILAEIREPLQVQPTSGSSMLAAYDEVNADLPNPPLRYDFINRSDSPTSWSLSSDASWLTVAQRVTHAATGQLPGHESTSIVAQINSQARLLSPGTHTAKLTFRNVATGRNIDRQVQFEISPPLRLEPQDPAPHHFTGYFGEVPSSPVSTRNVILRNASSARMGIAIAASTPWLSIASSSGLGGTLNGGDVRTLTVSPGPAATSLPVGVHSGVIRAAYTDGQRGVTGQVELAFRMEITEPLDVSPSEKTPWIVGPELEENALPIRRYTITSPSAFPQDVEISVEPANATWLSISTSIVGTPPHGSAFIDVAIQDEALLLDDGRHIAVITFKNINTGVRQCREVFLDVQQSISIVPRSGLAASGAIGQGLFPSVISYRLTNVARDAGGPLSWSAQVQPPEATWLSLHGGRTAGGVLNDGQSTRLVARIDPAAVAVLGAGDYSATILVRDAGNEEPTTRSVTLHLVESHVTPHEQLVQPDVLQPSGPRHTFFLGRSQVTNQQFCEFLNDAMLNPANQRGAFLYFDVSNGDVFVNTSELGESGIGAKGRALRVFRTDGTGQIEWINGVYRPRSSPVDFTLHPVAGVSWYGAVKFCNWLTLDQGMRMTDRCYKESIDASPSQWRPISVDELPWSLRDLNDFERDALIRSCRGYRLPMDDGAANASAEIDSADLYNEWFLAAAWSDQSTPPRNMTYGFGRDFLLNPDANFRCSLDPYENSGDCNVGSTTPVGFYDAANANVYGLFDMTGNVYQWMQDRFSTHVGNIGFRAIRGGSYNDARTGPYLKCAGRSFTRPDRIDRLIGLRFARSVAPADGDADVDADVDLFDAARLTAILAGPNVGMPDGGEPFDFDADSDVDLEDWAEFQIEFAGP